MSKQKRVAMAALSKCALAEAVYEELSADRSCISRSHSSLVLSHCCLSLLQGVPGGNVSILRGHSIGHSKHQSICMYMCPIPNGFRDTDISLYSSKTVDN
jgi:hypothetical protein